MTEDRKKILDKVNDLIEKRKEELLQKLHGILELDIESNLIYSSELEKVTLNSDEWQRKTLEIT
jgi:hypothetical protein